LDWFIEGKDNLQSPLNLYKLQKHLVNMKKSALLIVFAVAFMFMAGFALAAYDYGNSDNSNNAVNNPSSTIVGNDSDSHGCIGSAGYSWCEEKSKCLRVWEENCSSAESDNEIESDNKNESGKIKGNSVKIMPDTASARALEVLGAKCSEKGCIIEFKDVGAENMSNKNQTKLVYKITAEKDVKILGFIKAKMSVTAEVDADTGEVTNTKKPWWAFLSKEDKFSQNPPPSNCAKAGEPSSNPSLGPGDNPKQCCEGLKEISGAGMEQFIQNCLPMPGMGLICSDCGNNICESWENKCNCPTDCK